ncbi:hypothetical protein QAD02_014172 [Eretmocerus hayati]|uniref:Uncharacterized protein n=1 Tax=Eretmocerus hayati TaxID=131215 RepID=A0ACC2P476_9HYME|nr:hypothetical protein QAD02_014172 [Eretmocerus hayati]
MDHILKYVSSLEQLVTSCKAKSRNELEYVFPKEALNEVLSELDKINVRGIDSARKRRKRLTDKVNKIIDLLNSKVPSVLPPAAQPQPSLQEQREDSQPVSEKAQEQRQSELAQQQVEKIRDIMQMKFGNIGDKASVMQSEVRIHPMTCASLHFSYVERIIE